MRATFDKVTKWHTENRGWHKIGYNWIINPDGSGHRGREDHERGRHCANGGNVYGLGVLVCGNFSVQSVDPKQWVELVRVCASWCHKYSITPGRTTIVGHKDLQPMKGGRDKPRRHNTCPGNNLYARLPQLRVDVALQLAQAGNGLA